MSVLSRCVASVRGEQCFVTVNGRSEASMYRRGQQIVRQHGVLDVPGVEVIELERLAVADEVAVHQPVQIVVHVPSHAPAGAVRSAAVKVPLAITPLIGPPPGAPGT